MCDSLCQFIIHNLPGKISMVSILLDTMDQKSGTGSGQQIKELLLTSNFSSMKLGDEYHFHTCEC